MSNVQSLAVILCLAFLSVVTSLECYYCTSTLSWEDCDDKRTKVQCLPSQQCMKAIGHSSVEDIYVKDCARTCQASNIPVCQETGVECKVKCCSSDYCNDVFRPTDMSPTLHLNQSTLPTSESSSSRELTSRECYRCTSTLSWEDCDVKRIKVQCLTSQECIKASVHSSVEDAYVKGCATTCQASDVPICQQTDVECKVKCCSSDLCNDAFRPKGICPVPDTPQFTPCSGSSLSSPCNFLISISLSVFVFLKLQLKP